IITSGGNSYPGSGTTGDGYAWAEKLGHTVVPPRPALTPITTNEAWVRALQGITIESVKLSLRDGAAPTDRASLLDERRGSLLFPHFGLSGPVALDLSRAVSGHPHPESLWLSCDFLPDTRYDDLDQLLRQSAAATGRKQVASLLPTAIPG